MPTMTGFWCSGQCSTPIVMWFSCFLTRPHYSSPVTVCHNHVLLPCANCLYLNSPCPSIFPPPLPFGTLYSTTSFCHGSHQLTFAVFFPLLWAVFWALAECNSRMCLMNLVRGGEVEPCLLKTVRQAWPEMIPYRPWRAQWDVEVQHAHHAVWCSPRGWQQNWTKWKDKGFLNVQCVLSGLF